MGTNPIQPMSTTASLVKVLHGPVLWGARQALHVLLIPHALEVATANEEVDRDTLHVPNEPDCIVYLVQLTMTTALHSHSLTHMERWGWGVGGGRLKTSLWLWQLVVGEKVRAWPLTNHKSVHIQMDSNISQEWLSMFCQLQLPSSGIHPFTHQGGHNWRA